MTVDQPGGITRREMIGLGGAGALAGLAVAGLPLTAAAAPARQHVAAWGPAMQALGAPIAGLTYVGIDSSAFSNALGTRYYQGGQSGDPANTALMAALSLPVGSIIRQINVAVQATNGATFTVQLRENPFAAGPLVDPVVLATVTGTGVTSAVSTATTNLTTPITVSETSTYQINVLAPAGTTVRGVTVGYLPPTAGFVPFAGSTPRILDTRTLASGKIVADGELAVDLGNVGVRGALLNVTVTETEGLGFVAVFPDGITWPGNSSVNWAAPGSTVANGVVTSVAANGRVKVRVGGLPTAKAHVIIDRLGWFV